jgi:hypothetical protein
VRTEAQVRARLAIEFGESCEYRRPDWTRRIGDELRAAHREAVNGRLIACLVPGRTDTGWWHDYAQLGEVRFIQGRVQIDGHGRSPCFPSAVVVFGLAPAYVWWWPRDEQLRLAGPAA